MAETMHGFPFWQLEFDKEGRSVDPGAVDRLLQEVGAQEVADLFIFSHGWNNDHKVARSLYERFFGQMRDVLKGGQFPRKEPGAPIGLAGVLWPSILWPDDAESATDDVIGAGGGGAAAIGAAVAAAPAAQASPAAVNAELKKTYEEPRQQAILDELTMMLDLQPNDPAAIAAFKTKLGALLGTERPDAGADDPKMPDAAEGAMSGLSDARWQQFLEILADESAEEDGAGGGVGLGNPFKKLWQGAKSALRVATYWQMKQRAGVVGREGLGRAVLTPLAAPPHRPRVHLLGHSFGARLVSFSLSGLPETAVGAASPVKSLFLLQGAFSHYAFADGLPHDHARAGALRGMAARVDGPLLTTHSRRDLAVGLSYPAASFLNRDDAAAAAEKEIRWGAMGHDGAQAVDAVETKLAAPGARYPFQKGKWLNLDGNAVIIHGRPPSGAHSDIVHPHTAWAALTGAAIL